MDVLKHVIAILQFLWNFFVTNIEATRVEQVACDVIIAGGSTAALSAGIAAARYNTSAIVCLTGKFSGLDISDLHRGVMRNYF